ncbi:voltage-gated monoatomic cation channel TMEM109 isoform X1 [Hoplias malabaricus]|uniref:voltage-gated monoatomic cation channel TMEM109 isoform X1 n=1 Tax=Hoplias malabaricus TaxID=27720 RepID=UPI0034635522
MYIRMCIVLLLVAAGYCEKPRPTEEHPSPASLGSVSPTEYLNLGLGYMESVVGTPVLKTLCEKAVEFLESVFGKDSLDAISMFVEMVLKFVAEGAASGLNVIAVYVSEILRATGLGDPVSVPHFTTEGVSSVVKYALLALLGYWLLCVVLRVGVALLRRVFWILKSIVVLWIFARIVTDPSASADITTVRVCVLVILCAVLTVATAGVAESNTASLENRLSTLEGKVKVMEKKKTE